MSASPKVQRVVGVQFGGWFSMPLAAWADIVRAALNGATWDMTPYAVANRPRRYTIAYRVESWQYAATNDAWLAVMPVDWELSEWEATAWRLHDVDPLLMPLCPWCGFEAGLARGRPVPLHHEQMLGSRECLGCPVCKKSFLREEDGALDELSPEEEDAS